MSAMHSVESVCCNSEYGSPIGAAGVCKDNNIFEILLMWDEREHMESLSCSNI